MKRVPWRAQLVVLDQAWDVSKVEHPLVVVPTEDRVDDLRPRLSPP